MACYAADAGQSEVGEIVMEPVREYELRAFFQYVIEVLERLDIPYMVVGGFAAILYGEPRLTIDVDVLVDMQPRQVKAFVATFPPSDYYVSEEAVHDSLQRRTPFNVIQPRTGAKVDLVPLPPDPFSRVAFGHRRELVYDATGNTASFITAEDIVVSKLIAHRNSNSDKHLRDIRGVLVMQWDDLNISYIRQQANTQGLLETFETVLQAARREIEEEY